MKSHRTIKVIVNGEKYESTVETRKLLSDFLREELNISSVHVGCEHGICGTCNIILNGELIRSCLTLAVQADGAEITTVEGLVKDGQLHPIQKAFHENHGAQCGFCTPGQVLNAHSFLQRNPNPSEDEIRTEVAGNLCRCTGYYHIIESIKDAAKKMRES